jgi:prevent-host-death family protein
MVMSSPARRAAGQRLRRLGVAEAKAHFAEVLRTAEIEPVVIHNRGRDVAVVLSIAEHEALTREKAPAGSTGKRLVRALEEWRDRCGGVDFEPARARIVPHSWVRPRR